MPDFHNLQVAALDVDEFKRSNSVCVTGNSSSHMPFSSFDGPPATLEMILWGGVKLLTSSGVHTITYPTKSLQTSRTKYLLPVVW